MNASEIYIATKKAFLQKSAHNFTEAPLSPLVSVCIGKTVKLHCHNVLVGLDDVILLPMLMFSSIFRRCHSPPHARLLGWKKATNSSNKV